MTVAGDVRCAAMMVGANIRAVVVMAASVRIVIVKMVSEVAAVF